VAAAAPTPAQAAAPAATAYRRPALLQGLADQAGGAARPGAAAIAGVEPGRTKHGPAGADADASLRRSAPDAALPAGETQAAAWMRALEAAVNSPAEREARADAPSLAGAGTPSVQETGFSADRATGPAQEASAPTARIEAALNSPEFAPMLGTRIAALLRDGVEQARISLNPQEMGPISVQLALDGSKVSVELAAEVEATRIALEQALPTLAGALHEAGFTLAGGGVFQQSRDSGGAASQQDQAWAGRDATPVSGAPQAAAAPAAAARAGRPQGLVDLYA
jgi:flagellar hook-length control protein FliK